MFLEIDILTLVHFFSSCPVCMTQQTSNATKNATILHRIAINKFVEFAVSVIYNVITVRYDMPMLFHFNSNVL